jgi:hypothetical protein
MKEKSDMAKSTGGDVFMPIAVMGESADDHGKGSADDTEEESGNC